MAEYRSFPISSPLFLLPGTFHPRRWLLCLSILTSLESLWLNFSGPRFPLPPKRSVLPVLTSFRFRGLSKYLEDLVVRIDAPRLNELTINFFDKIRYPQLAQFIGHTPTLETSRAARSCWMAAFVSTTSLYLKPFHPGFILAIRIASRNPNG